MPEKIFDLDELGRRIRRTDRHLLALLAQRQALSMQVGRIKRKSKQPIFRPKAEDARLKEAEHWAVSSGLNPNFARAVLYLIIGESCKTQMALLQDNPEPETEVEEGEEAKYQRLKQNLLKLAADWARTYDQRYARPFSATHAYMEFEDRILKEIIQAMPPLLLGMRGNAVDLGCANGRTTFLLSKELKHVTGYDLSPAMIEIAEKKRTEFGCYDNVLFQVEDIEGRIPKVDDSTSLVVMNLGTASDIRNLGGTLKEIHRVLEPNGIAFLSFYNSQALLYKFGFLPWPVGLAAEINLAQRCLDVHTEGGEILQVYARPYSAAEVRKMLRSAGLRPLKLQTHPTLLSILPADLFADHELRNLCLKADRELALAGSGYGAYIIAVAKKRKTQ